MAQTLTGGQNAAAGCPSGPSSKPATRGGRTHLECGRRQHFLLEGQHAVAFVRPFLQTSTTTSPYDNFLVRQPRVPRGRKAFTQRPADQVTQTHPRASMIKHTRPRNLRTDWGSRETTRLVESNGISTFHNSVWSASSPFTLPPSLLQRQPLVETSESACKELVEDTGATCLPRTTD